MKAHANAVLVLVAGALALELSCAKSVTTAPPVAAAPPAVSPRPVASERSPSKPEIDSFTVEPSVVESGQPAFLSWQVRDATAIAISPDVGDVPASGRRQILPDTARTYTLTAKGTGGTASAFASVRVVLPLPGSVTARVGVQDLKEAFSEIRDAYFDLDRTEIRDDAQAVLVKNAEILRAIFQRFPDVKIVIEGHCDERASAEYNFGIGDRRASTAMDLLVQIGLPADRLSAVSWGEERPQCLESEETCWQKNRRVHFALSR